MSVAAAWWSQVFSTVFSPQTARHHFWSFNWGLLRPSQSSGSRDKILRLADSLQSSSLDVLLPQLLSVRWGVPCSATRPLLGRRRISPPPPGKSGTAAPGGQQLRTLRAMGDSKRAVLWKQVSASSVTFYPGRTRVGSDFPKKCDGTFRAVLICR